MKAAVYYGKEGIRVEEKAIPQVGEKDVLVRNLRAGICGTDINIVRGGAGDRGISIGAEFGHEMVGEVVEIGTAVASEVTKGMIVGINPVTAKRAGRRQSLEASGFSEYVLIEDAALNYNLYDMGEDCSLESAVLIEPMSVGRHGAFRANPKPIDKIVVLGAGPIGMSAAASLIAEGFPNVCVVDTNDWRLKKAEHLGASVLNTMKQDLAPGLSEQFGEVNVYGQMVPDVDVFIDAAGAPVLFEQVMKIVKPGAKISIIAVYKDEVPVSLAQVMSKEVSIQGASGYTDGDIRKVVDHIINKKTDIATMVTQVFKLDDIEEAFRVAIKGEGTVKVIVDLT
ncbi:Zn-dependent dehydrogenase [Listeria grandensis FSL F6-0971]|uniref:Zn-dependent dehydrogenase n=1 Tax=Listeria grandensis FSL F6-0971 TaxID=1265819 RepID=W7B8N2_9LIST|nr:zinc-binding dehydrogenase [Listeria grandensis]EUJ23664.1 Zn-dependent dehydrogenase [Listeria grandensis FSL F6-0971]